ncbi:hypothetical protein ABZ532_14620 [Streptomyces sp. NPDC019396]|uniref:hypothetical protein n=1 Tax=Streptomyces sp. NPDC019396 TaxID=3154687 RepID=UPI0034116FBD
MVQGGSRRTTAGVLVSVVVIVASIALTWWMLPQVKVSDADPAGVLSLAVGVIGTVAGVGGLAVAVRSAQQQRTGEIAAQLLARSVVRLEGAEYRQLLGGGTSALNGRIDLPFTVVEATGVTGTAGSAGAPGIPAGGTLETVADFFQGLSPGRLVITGTPSPVNDPSGAPPGSDAGTGKTVLASALVLQLAERREPGARVPVRLTAAAWPGSEIRAWVMSHLIDVYRLTGRDAELVVTEDLVLPVIDGLDELDSVALPGPPGRAALLLSAVERYERGAVKAPVVMTCRDQVYRSLQLADSQPQVVVHIALTRVTGEQARHYLETRVGYSARNRARWQQVLDALAPPPGAAGVPDAAVVQALSTPWRLTLAAVVFEERDEHRRQFRRSPHDVLALAQSGQLYGLLLDQYVAAAVKSTLAHPAETEDESRLRGEEDGRAPLPRLKAATTWRHLAVLAGYLHSNSLTSARRAGRNLSSTDLVLHELWPLSPRSRAVGTALIAAVLLLSMLTGVHLLRRTHGGQAAGEEFLVLVFTVLILVATFLGAWPVPLQLRLRPMTTWPQRRRALGWVVGGTFVGLTLGGGLGTAATLLLTAVFGFFIGLIVFFRALLGLPSVDMGIGNLLKNVYLVMISISVTVGAMAGVARALWRPVTEPTGDPRSFVRRDALSAVAVAAAVVTAIALAFGLSAHVAAVVTRTPGRGAAPAAALGFTLALAAGPCLALARGRAGAASLRYLALLLCTRRRLPWRLGRFLHTCHQLGLLRTAGAGYQFRHRELQDHLAAAPTPPAGY